MNAIQEYQQIAEQAILMGADPSQWTGEINRIIGDNGEYQGYSFRLRKHVDTVEMWQKYGEEVKDLISSNYFHNG